MRWLDISVLLHMYMSIAKEKKTAAAASVRVEARDRRCLIEVHLRCVGLEPGSRCRVYGFVRREGLMDGILIGSCVTGREQIECVLETETENIGDRGKNLRDLGGMLLISDAGGFWGTVVGVTSPSGRRISGSGRRRKRSRRKNRRKQA